MRRCGPDTSDHCQGRRPFGPVCDVQANGGTDGMRWSAPTQILRRSLTALGVIVSHREVSPLFPVSRETHETKDQAFGVCDAEAKTYALVARRAHRRVGHLRRGPVVQASKTLDHSWLLSLASCHADPTPLSCLAFGSAGPSNDSAATGRPASRATGSAPPPSAQVTGGDLCCRVHDHPSQPGRAGGIEAGVGHGGGDGGQG